MAGLRILILGADADDAIPSNARELAEQLEAHPAVESVEVLDRPRARRRRLGRLLPSALLTVLGRGGAGMAPALNAVRPHVVVSWDPALSARLGALRAAQRFPIPLLSAAADLHQLEHAVGPGVDVYLLPWPAQREAAEAIAGAGRVVIVAPPLDSAFLAGPAHGSSRGWAARQLKLSLKGGRPLIVVGGGASGVGDIAGAVRTAVQAVPEAAVVALAGAGVDAESQLTSQLAEIEQIRVLGPTDRLATLLAAADAFVDTGGGGLEAAVVGCPVVPAGGGLGADLVAALDAPRPEPLDPTGLGTAADAVVAAAYAG